VLARAAFIVLSPAVRCHVFAAGAGAILAAVDGALHAILALVALGAVLIVAPVVCIRGLGRRSVICGTAKDEPSKDFGDSVAERHHAANERERG
jgi:hypothetical protein